MLIRVISPISDRAINLDNVQWMGPAGNRLHFAMGNEREAMVFSLPNSKKAYEAYVSILTAAQQPHVEVVTVDLRPLYVNEEGR